MSFQRESAVPQAFSARVSIEEIIRPVRRCTLKFYARHRSYGFDPLGLAAQPDLRSRFQESELIHCRWAMAGVAGALAVELAGQGNWITAQTWVCTSAVWPFANMHCTYLLRHNIMVEGFCTLQAREGGSPTFLGIPLPFNFGTILAAVSQMSCNTPGGIS